MPADNGACKGDLGATTVGLIYVNPEGPMKNPDPIGSAEEIRDTFKRMGMNDYETVVLIGGGHSIGKTHGACPDGPGPAPREDPEKPWPGVCHNLTLGPTKGKGKNAFTSGFDFPWTSTPITFSNKYFKNLKQFQWDVTNDTLGGKNQWHSPNITFKAPDIHWNDNTDNIGMLTADIALIKADYYETWVDTFQKDQSLDQFVTAFK